MANTFFSTGDQRAARVKDLFTIIAPRYDLLNDLQSFGLHRFWKRRLIQLTDVKAGQRALDLCCGTGDLAFALARQGAEVVGVDFSEAMLKIAERKNPKPDPLRRCDSAARTRNPKFLSGDAQNISFPDNSFDVVTVGYGLRNLADWETGLREMIRVAKPGGRLLVLDFGKPDNKLWRAIYFGYLKLCVPVFGTIFCGNSAAYAYILESLKHYPAQRGVAEKMRALGLSDVRIVNFLGGIMSINYAQKSLDARASSLP